jgi:EAL domain-containing protein (putative c-di-GMP-specific phosphodiesterase class I)
VIAEGVETQAQLDFLAARDCHCFQGYWVSRPLPVAEFDRFLAASPQRQQPAVAESSLVPLVPAE